MSTPGAICSKCGSAIDWGRILCSKCGTPIRTPVSLLPNSNREPGTKLRAWYKFSAREVGSFVAMYGFSFLLFRFDISKHHPFRYPMSNRNAAVYGLGLTIGVILYQKWIVEKD